MMKTRTSFIGLICGMIIPALLFTILSAGLAMGTEIATGEAPQESTYPTFDPDDVNSLSPISTHIGNLSVSIDAIGFLDSPTGIVEVEKPAGATVEKAYLATATRGFSGYALSPGDVKLNGTDVTWDMSLGNSISSYNYFADVTSMLEAAINAAPAGRINVVVTELDDYNIEANILTVIFNDPAVTEDVTIVILFGAQDVAGDNFNIALTEPIQLPDPDLVLQMSLGISYGYQTPEVQDQFSLIDVNGMRLTSSAGGQDDGVGGNGALVTVGGLDDDPANPPDPFSPPLDFDYDDELYDIKPFVNDGDQIIQVSTLNPSNDDNIFFGAFILGVAAIVPIEEALVLTPGYAQNEINTDHTVTGTLVDQDAQPVVGRTVDFEIISGPHAGLTGSDLTNASGKATFTYTGTMVGTDVIRGSFTNADGDLQYSENDAVKEWIPPGPVPGLCAMNPDPIYVYWANAIDPWTLITYIGNFEQGYTANDVDFSTVLIDGSIAPTDYSMVTGIPDFVGDVMALECPLPWYVMPLLPVIGSETFSVQVTGQFTDSREFEANGEVVVIGKNIITHELIKPGEEVELPTGFQVYQNYPNPFNPETEIAFYTSEAGRATVDIYNIQGQLVRSLYDQYATPGQVTVTWNGRNDLGETVGSGIYFYKVTVGSHVEVKKMTLLK